MAAALSTGRAELNSASSSRAAANQTQRALHDRSNAPLVTVAVAVADPDALPVPRSRYPAPARAIDAGADKERYGREGEAVKPMEPVEACEGEVTRADEGTRSDETMRSN